MPRLAPLCLRVDERLQPLLPLLPSQGELLPRRLHGGGQHVGVQLPRRRQQPATRSPHTYGRSLDLNTWENPYHSARGLVHGKGDIQHCDAVTGNGRVMALPLGCDGVCE